MTPDNAAILNPNRDNQTVAKDHIIETEDGFDCIVRNRRFGTWRSHAEARGGMQTEQRRAAERPYLTQPQWNDIVAEYCEA